MNVTQGIYSKKTVSNGLSLSATSTFRPISILTTKISLDKRYSVFVHYQLTLFSTNVDFQSMLLINDANAGSMVHSGNQKYKTATGFYMVELNAGEYEFEILYKSPRAILVQGSWSWQTAVLQVIWAEDSRVVSDGIKCYPTPVSTNSYNAWGPIRDLEAVLHLPTERAVLSAYQLSTKTSTPTHVLTGLHVDNFYQQTSSIIKGDSVSLDLHGSWAGVARAGLHYFGLNYRTPASISFTDCNNDYTNNKNLYAMMMPPSCKVVTVNPKTGLSLTDTDNWAATDLTYSLTLPKQAHVIAMYQYGGWGGSARTIMRLSIDSVPQPHTASINGDNNFTGNFGLWQGSLASGEHTFTVDYRSTAATTNTVLSVDWAHTNGHAIWHNRVLTVIYC